MSRFHRPNIGSIGTQGYQTSGSLIDSFIGELRQQRPLHEADRELLRVIDSSRSTDARTPQWVEKLVHALSKYAPKGYHFGPSSSDPTDFGYWPDEEDSEGSAETAERKRAEESLAANTAEAFVASEFQQQ